jgi:hypothetical protein
MYYRSKLNPFSGKLAGEVEVLDGYATGNFQGGSNKFVRALNVLLDMPEYQEYNWRSAGYQKRDKDEEYYRLLAKALATKPSKKQYVVYRNHLYTSGDRMYIKRINKYTINLTQDRNKARKFVSEGEVKRLTAIMDDYMYERIA